MVEVGISFATIKSLLIFFAPVILPRIFNFYRSTRAAIARQPNPKPLPASASRSLNLLFCAILLFLLLSLPFNPYAPSPSIFSITRSRINTPIDILFSRLARTRPDGILTAADHLLKSKLTSQTARKIYLRFGADPLTECQFCSLDNPLTYALYYLPLNTLLPHLLHMALVGVTTSAPFAGRQAARWRTKSTIAGLSLAALDIYTVLSFPSTLDPTKPSPPTALFEQSALLRPLSLAIFDATLSLVIYLSATNRLFVTLPTQAEQIESLATASVTALSAATTKLHAVSVTRNAVVRDRVLKDRDDDYWRTVVVMDSVGNTAARTDGGTGIWEEEEVVRAMSRAMAGQGGVDVVRLGVSAAEYVNGVTAGLENGSTIV